MSDYLPVLAAVVAYLIGSLSFAVIVSRVMGLHDPRSHGSKNPGATNVLRSGNKKAAAVTLLLDAVKGWLPTWWVAHWGAGYGLGEGALALRQPRAGGQQSRTRPPSSDQASRYQRGGGAPAHS